MKRKLQRVEKCKMNDSQKMKLLIFGKTTITASGLRIQWTGMELLWSTRDGRGCTKQSQTESDNQWGHQTSSGAEPEVYEDSCISDAYLLKINPTFTYH